MEEARQAVQRIRDELLRNPITVGDQPISVTMTFGIAALTEDLDVAVREADAAMYRGKHGGRDSIIVAGTPEPPTGASP